MDFRQTCQILADQTFLADWDVSCKILAGQDISCKILGRILQDNVWNLKDILQENVWNVRETTRLFSNFKPGICSNWMWMSRICSVLFKTLVRYCLFLFHRNISNFLKEVSANRFFMSVKKINNLQNKQQDVQYGHYAQRNYAQTEIMPKEIKLFKANSSDYFQVIIWRGLHICCMARSLRSLRQVATLRHGHMARRCASLRSCI